MSILIKGKAKPDFCYHCWFCRQNHFPARFDTFYECILMEQEISGGFIPSDCPLVEIDDELYEKAVNAYVLQQVRYRNVDNH